MAKFKAGQKVVFVGGQPIDVGCIVPKINEIITIHSMADDGGWYIVEYPLSIEGNPQFFFSDELRPLDYRDSSLEEILSKFKMVEEKADIEILVPMEL